MTRPLATMLLILTNGHLLLFSSQVMSEIPYLCLSMAALWAFEKGDEDHLSWLIGGLLLAFLAYQARSVGISLVVTLAALLYFRHRFYAAALGVTVVVIAMSLKSSAYTSVLLSVDPYRPEKGILTLWQFAERIWTNILIYTLAEIPKALYFPLLDPEWQRVVWALIPFIVVLFTNVLLAYGLWRGLRNCDAWAFYLVAYGVTILCWPQAWSDKRFLVPVIPLMYWAMVNGAADIYAKIERKWNHG